MTVKPRFHLPSDGPDRLHRGPQTPHWELHLHQTQLPISQHTATLRVPPHSEQTSESHCAFLRHDAQLFPREYPLLGPISAEGGKEPILWGKLLPPGQLSLPPSFLQRGLKAAEN